MCSQLSALFSPHNMPTRYAQVLRQMPGAAGGRQMLKRQLQSLKSSLLNLGQKEFFSEGESVWEAQCMGIPPRCLVRPCMYWMRVMHGIPWCLPVHACSPRGGRGAAHGAVGPILPSTCCKSSARPPPRILLVRAPMCVFPFSHAPCSHSEFLRAARLQGRGRPQRRCTRVRRGGSQRLEESQPAGQQGRRGGRHLSIMEEEEETRRISRT